MWRIKKEMRKRRRKRMSKRSWPPGESTWR
jgi:hypothetical protein